MAIDPAGFMKRFEGFWSAPTADSWQDIFTPEATLFIPPAEEAMTYDQLPGYMAELLKVVPDITLEVHRWGASEDGVLIEWTLTGTASDGPFTASGMDRVILDGDRSKGSVAYLDPAPLLAALGAGDA